MSDNKILVGDMSRKQCLEVLKRLLEAMETFDGISPSPERINALKMAIASLETDEAYQLEYESTTKNDLGVECVSRDDVRDVMQELWGTSGELMDRLMALPSVTPQESIKPVLEDIKAEIKRKANSGQWSDATVYGMQKAIAIIDKHISGK